MMTKRILLAVLLFVIGCFALAGCSGDASSRNDFSIEDGDRYYFLIVEQSVGGHVSVDGDLTSCKQGESIVVRVNVENGYYLAKFTVNDVDYLSYLQDGVYTFEMPAKPVTISVSYEETDTFNAQITYVTDGGEAFLSKTQGISAGELVQVDYSCSEDYAFDCVKVNGNVVELQNGCFEMPSQDARVQVFFKKVVFTLSLSVSGQGQASIDGQVAKLSAGDTVTVNFSSTAGYKVCLFSINGVDYTSIAGGSKASFVMPEKDISIVVEFGEVDGYKATLLSVSEGGSAQLSKKYGLNAGDLVSLNLTLDEGYELDYVKVNGQKVTLTNGAITMPDANAEIQVAFKKSVYTITATAQNGTCLVSALSASMGDVITVTTTANEGYDLREIKVNNQAISGNTFTMPAGNVTVTAIFAKQEYTITVTQATGGTITASKTSANYGDSITLTNSASTGYSFSSYTVKNGSTTITVTNNAFTMPAGNVTVTGSFTLNKYSVKLNIYLDGSIPSSSTLSSEGITADFYVGSTKKSAVTTYNATENYGIKIYLNAVNISKTAWYTFSKYTIGGTDKGTSLGSSQGVTLGTSGLTINVYVVTKTYTITKGSVSNGSLTVSATSAKPGTTITLSYSANAGYKFSSYTVDGTAQTANTFTMPAKSITVTVTFVKGITGLSNLTLDKNYNWGTGTSGSISVNGGSVTNSQSGYPFVYSKARADFFYQTEITLNKNNIKNGELYPKVGISVNVGVDWMFFCIDALTNGYNNQGYGTNTWVIAVNGRGELGQGVEWYWADIAERKFNFNKNYAAATTFKLGLLRTGAVYRFFVNDALAMTLWLPHMTDTANIGILSFNIGYTSANNKLGTSSTALTNVKAYYGINAVNPTSVTLDGYTGDWADNAKTYYGISDYTGEKYFYAAAFKASDGVYVAVQARSAKYITNNSNWWESTNVEMRYASGDSNQIFASANGQKSNVTTAVFKEKQDGALHSISVEMKIPLSLWSGTPKIGFAFRSEDNAANMCEGCDSVWWCGIKHINAQNFTVSATGLSVTNQQTPDGTAIKTGVGLADPYVMYNSADSTYYMYGTGSVVDYTYYSSTDLTHWKKGAKVLTKNGASSPVGSTWAVNAMWAPEVTYNSSTKKYVMFYSGYIPNDNALPKVGVATSDSPKGPFVDVYGEPFLYPNKNVASIDATLFIDSNGTPYLYYSKDCARNYIENYLGDGIGRNVSQIWCVKLDSTYTRVAEGNNDRNNNSGTHVEIATPTQDWEIQEDSFAGNTLWNEGPYVWKENGTYYLTYSANPFWNSLYGVGLAIAKNPKGPFVKYAGNPIVIKDPGVTAGTGHSMMFRDKNGQLWCSFHTFSDPNFSYNGSKFPKREALLARAWFKDGIMQVEYDSVVRYS